MKKILVVLLVATPCFADLSIYPAEGQNAKQQEKDKFECYDWAKGQTGFDPRAAAAAGGAEQQKAPSGGRAKGAAKGAAAGAVGGAIGGNAGKGAGIGAGVGAVAGGSKQRRQRREAEQKQEQAKAQQQQQLASFDKAQAACLEGRGYKVK